MRVLMLSRTLPAPTGVGSSVHVWSLLESLVDAGHEVRLCLSNHPSKVEGWRSRMYRNAGEDLVALGVEIRFLTIPAAPTLPRAQRAISLLKRTVAPSLIDFYPEVALEDALRAEVDDWSPDALCLWEIEAVAAARNVAPELPRLAFFTDPDHLIRVARRRYRPATTSRERFNRLLDQIAERRLPATIVGLLKSCDVVVDHASHHAEWFRLNGVPHAEYLPVPVIDRVRDRWEACRAEFAHDGPPRVLLIGNLNSNATLPGLRLFAFTILPALDRLLGQDGFQVHIVGGGRLPADIEHQLGHPAVKLRGYVDDVQPEFLACDVLLVPTDSDLGFRTRIAEGMSFGCCVVAHTSNALGMPELQHRKNALLDREGGGLARMVAECLRDGQLRRELGRNARETFSEHLDGKRVCNTMIDRLESFLGDNASGLELDTLARSF